MSAKTEVLVIYKGGPWDGMDYIERKEVIDHFLGQTVQCPYSEELEAKMKGERPIEPSGNYHHISVYKFDDSYADEDGDAVYLRFVKIYQRARRS